MFDDEDDRYDDYDDNDGLYEFDPELIDEIDRFDEAVENMYEVYNDWDDE